MDLEEMFDDLFTTYSSLDPPPIKRKTDDLTKLDLKEINPNSYKMVSTIDNPDINWSLEQEGIYNPFSFQTDEPYFEVPKLTLNTNSLALNAVNLARSFVGGNYTWGGKSPSSGFDCSGLISYVYKLSGADIPATTFGLFKTGTEVSLSNAQIGDIICTPGSGRSGRHVKMISKIDPDGQIYTIEAKGRKYGIVESPLTRTDNIITIRRITGLANQSPQVEQTNGTFSSRKDFVRTLNSTYREVLKEHKLDPDYSYILTSAAAEASPEEDYNSLRYSYLEALENPTKEGFNERTQRWTPPKRKGFDQNLIGIGLDMRTNTRVRDFLKRNGRTGSPWLSHQEMINLLNDSLLELENILNRHTKGIKLSNTKRAIAIGLLYHGFGPKLWNPNGPKTLRLNRALFNGSDQDFINAVTDFYNGTYSLRSKSHSNFWKGKQ